MPRGCTRLVMPQGELYKALCGNHAVWLCFGQDKCKCTQETKNPAVATIALTLLMMPYFPGQSDQKWDAHPTDLLRFPDKREFSFVFDENKDTWKPEEYARTFESYCDTLAPDPEAKRFAEEARDKISKARKAADAEVGAEKEEKEEKEKEEKEDEKEEKEKEEKEDGKEAEEKEEEEGPWCTETPCPLTGLGAEKEEEREEGKEEEKEEHRERKVNPSHGNHDSITNKQNKQEEEKEEEGPGRLTATEVMKFKEAVAQEMARLFEVAGNKAKIQLPPQDTTSPEKVT
ncbi:unnamed protein product [Amoebophrya sp. A120]|nr:unnamed protein product [Amoebophrya sp. A120]|eukprot:GSA120T00016595001.1